MTDLNDSNPESLLPATACRLQNLLGLRTSSFAFDVNLGCSAYPYGLWLAASLMSSGVNRILLLAGTLLIASWTQVSGCCFSLW